MSSTPIDETGQVQATWNILSDLQQLLAFHFMHNAFLSGTLIAVVAGTIGYFMVLRSQSFAGHTLANVGFAGAAGASLVGVSPVVGLLVFCVAAAFGVGLLTGRQRTASGNETVAIATVHTFWLGLGLLFEHLTSHYAAGLYAILFGAVLGISDGDVALVAVVAIVALVALAAMARPLLFASVDPVVAETRGVPAQALAYFFLVLLALAVAEAVQVVGVLLIFSLLVTPAAIARRLTARPGAGVALSVLLALLFTWIGLAVAYFTAYPVGFFISSLAFGAYVVVRALGDRSRSATVGPRALRAGGVA